MAITFRLHPEVHSALGRYATETERTKNVSANRLLRLALQSAGYLPATPQERSE